MLQKHHINKDSLNYTPQKAGFSNIRKASDAYHVTPENGVPALVPIEENLSDKIHENIDSFCIKNFLEKTKDTLSTLNTYTIEAIKTSNFYLIFGEGISEIINVLILYID